MHNATLKVALVLLTAATAGCQSRTSHGGSAGTSSGGSIQLQDPGLNMSAGTLTYPAGWQAQGEMDRAQPCAAGSANPQFNLRNQSQQMFIRHMLPFATFSSQGVVGNTDIRSCGAVSQLTHAADILQRFIAPALTGGLQGAQVGRPESIPGDTPSRNPNGGIGFGASSDSARVHVSYTENGQAREEWIVGYTTVTYFPGNGFNGTTSTVVSVISSPQGQLETAYNVATKGLDVKPSPQWQQANNQQQQQANDARTQAGKRTVDAIHEQANANMQNSINQSNANIDQIHRIGNASMQAAKNSADALHDSAQATADYVGDKTRYWTWRNTLTGETTTTSTRNSPGRNWVPN